MPRFLGDSRRDLSRPLEKLDIIAHADDEDLRLDHFLRKRLPWRSRSYLQGLIRFGRILVNGQVQRTSKKMKKGDRIRIWVEPPRYEGPHFCHIPIRILYEDEVLIALNKQPGLVVHPVSKYVSGTLINLLHYHFRNTLDPARDVIPMLVHRLDMNTSGLILIAKNEVVRANLSMQFEKREVEKEYLAVTDGTPPSANGTIELPIGAAENSEIRIKMGVRKNGGAPARTDFEVVKDFGCFSFVHLKPKTGRTHQLRVHLSEMGCPVLCDHLYSDRAEIFESELLGEKAPQEGKPLLNRHALHSHRLTFCHPLRKERMTLEAPLYEDMRAVLQVLEGL